MRKYRNQIFIGLIIVVGIYIVILLFAESQGYFSQSEGILEQLSRFSWPLIPVLILAQTLVIIFRFVEWHYYLGVIGARRKLSLLDSVAIFVSMFTMVVSPGKAAEVLKSVLLKAKTAVPIVRSAPIVIAERVVDGLAVILIMVLTLLIGGKQLSLGTYNGVDYNLLSRTIIFSSALVIAAGLIIIQIKSLAYFCLNLLTHVPLVRRAYQPLVGFYESSRQIFSLRHVVPMTIVGSGVYLSSSLGFVVILYGFGLEITTQLLLQAMFIVGIASAVGALSFVPNGAGVTEISNIGMLLALVAPLNPEMTPAVAAAAALMQGFFHKWFRVLVGLGVAIIFRKRLFDENLQAVLMDYEAHKQKKKRETPPLEGHPLSL